MSVSTNLELFQMAAASSQKDVVLNLIISQLEGAVSGSLDVATTDIDGAGQTLALPFDDSNDLSSREALHNFFFTLTTGATDDFDLTHPSNPHLFVLQNDTAVTVTIETEDQVATPPALAAGARGLFYCDGTDVFNLLSNIVAATKTEDYHIHFVDASGPSTSQLLGKFIVPRELTFAADFGASVGVCETTPATAWDVLVKDDGTEIGTATINTDGTVAFATDSNAAQTVAAGSVLVFETDTTVYASSEIFLNFVGTSET